jgi:hypothetical protein
MTLQAKDKSLFVRYQYDISTAVPFFLIGLGMGTVLVLLLAPHPAISAQESMARPRHARKGLAIAIANQRERASA